MSLRLYRLPEACSAPDCPDDPVAVVIGVVTPVMTPDEVGDVALVVPER